MRHIDTSAGLNGGRRRLIGGAAAALLGLSETTTGRARTLGSDALGKLPIEGMFPSLGGAVAWLNSEPLNAMELRGKVVLVNFWTLTCINWLRTLPYIRAWSEKYRKQGLVVIGAHTPEFRFEQDIDNVRRASADLSLDYPIAVDSNYAIWRAFQNRYWPALYLVDAQGRVRHHRFGEGEYTRSEQAIQQLLIEAGRDDVTSDLSTVEGVGVQAEADWGNLKSPETYLGYTRAERFASPGGLREDTTNLYRIASIRLNSWGYSGRWTVGDEFGLLSEAAGRITYRFHARDLHLILAPAVPDRAIRFRITLDGMAPGTDHGSDVDAAGLGTVHEGRLYQLVRQSGAIGDRTFEIEFLDPGLRAYAFTLG